ncbi:unnamed protein product [Eruca vesicaria subsp. sativa]|uniref:F-box domain-containing protein n=1 Tax=Eruca vesicaria subsp. sativa TaxID=29727 RepID=A0ABC8LTR7_ERUVS|nr:unnamed protein product [Eruca vesicaria subsp. sativa]
MDITKTKQKKKAAHEEQLPWELIEEILSRVPLKSLVRLSVVCKRWNIILDDKKFINSHKETFRFILTTKSKIYSVSIDPKIVVRELPGLIYINPETLIDCDEFLICNVGTGAVIWNPWRSEVNLYKSIWGIDNMLKIHDFEEFGTWTHVNVRSGDSNQRRKRTTQSEIGVSLNGSLFWICYLDKTDPLYCLGRFDFSKERFYTFCELPCGMSHIEIWVTKNKVDVEDGGDVVWVELMTLSIPNFPSLGLAEPNSQQPSYYIDDKRLVVCCCDESGQPWIYVFGEDKLISKVQLDSLVGLWPSHCTYFPSLVPVPRVKDEAKLQV